MGCTVGRTPGGLTAGRGRGVLGLGGLRACEGVRGRARACEGVFYPDPSIVVSLTPGLQESMID